MSGYEIAVVAFAAVTAGATSVAAYLAWRSYLGRLRIEYVLDWTNAGNEVLTAVLRLTIRNNTPSAFEIGSIEVVQPPMVQFGSKDKHHSWGPNSSPLPINEPLEPGRVSSTRLTYEPDWAAWAQREQRSLRYRLLRLLRREAIPAYSVIVVYARDVSSPSRLKRHKRKVIVYAHRVIKQAEVRKIKA